MTFDRIIILLLLIAVFILTKQVSEWAGALGTIKLLIEQFQPGMNT